MHRASTLSTVGHATLSTDPRFFPDDQIVGPIRAYWLTPEGEQRVAVDAVQDGRLALGAVYPLSDVVVSA